VATAPIDGLAPLLVLLRRSSGTPPQVRDCERLLLGAGLDRGATSDDDTFSHACEQSDTTQPPLPVAVHVQWVAAGS
jgi:hypothetical protein